jgi:hypothetical protein
MGKNYSKTDPYRRTTLRAVVEAKTIAKNEVAQLVKKAGHPPCWCGRATYRLNANEAEVCTGCNNGIGVCDCKPYNPKLEILRG